MAVFLSRVTTEISHPLDRCGPGLAMVMYPAVLGATYADGLAVAGVGRAGGGPSVALFGRRKS